MKDAKKKNTPKNHFKVVLQKYLDIKGLDIIVQLLDGNEVELFKNRSLEGDVIVSIDGSHNEQRINISDIKAIDLYAA